MIIFSFQVHHMAILCSASLSFLLCCAKIMRKDQQKQKPAFKIEQNNKQTVGVYVLFVC